MPETFAYYELTTVAAAMVDRAQASDRAWAWVTAPGAAGTPLGHWQSEIGALGRVILLRGFADAAALGAERRRALLDRAPFGATDPARALEMRGYAPFPFLPPVAPRVYGGVYEIRDYRLQPGGLAPTIAAWEEAVPRAPEYTSHLVINMYALDGEPRITHLWGYETLEQRARLRAEAFGSGRWPPKGGPGNIREATSTIALSEPTSPLR